MATVRELVAKLAFDVDMSGAEKFDKGIKGLTQGLSTLFGAKMLKGAASLEDSFLSSQRKIKFLAGSEGLKALNEALNTVSKTASQVDIAEAMRAGLEMTTDPIFTQKMVEFGGLLADAFGGSLQENTQNLIQGALSGDFSGMVSAGLFTAQEAEFLKGANINTVQGKLTTIFKTNGKILEVMKAQAEAEKTADFQMRRFGATVENVGKVMGEVISPVIAFILDVVNDIADVIFRTDAGKIAAQFVALAAAAKVFLVPMKFIGAIIGKIGFSIGGVISGFARLANIWVTIGLAANAFFKLMTGENLLKPFQVLLDAIPQVIEAFSKMGSFFGGKISDKFSGLGDVIGGVFGEGEAVPSPAIAGASNTSSMVDNRKASIVVHVANGDSASVQKGVEGAIRSTGIAASLNRASTSIAARDRQVNGANAQ